MFGSPETARWKVPKRFDVNAPHHTNVVSPLIPERLDWPSAIGNLLLNFGTLEYFVFVFLKDHLSSEEFAKVQGSHFKDRTARMTLQLQRENLPAEQQTRFAQLLERLEPIRELRNHIAHGHMYLRFDTSANTHVMTVLKSKDVDSGSLPETTHVELSDLLNALTTLPTLIDEFQRLAGFQTERYPEDHSRPGADSCPL